MMKAAQAAAEEAGMAGMSVDISDDAPAVPDRLDTTIVPLCFTSTKAGAGVTLTDDGKTAASDGKGLIPTIRFGSVWCVWWCDGLTSLYSCEPTDRLAAEFVGPSFFSRAIPTSLCPCPP